MRRAVIAACWLASSWAFAQPDPAIAEYGRALRHYEMCVADWARGRATAANVTASEIADVAVGRCGIEQAQVAASVSKNPLWDKESFNKEARHSARLKAIEAVIDARMPAAKR